MDIHKDTMAVLQSSSALGMTIAMEKVSAGLTDDHWLSNAHRYRNKGRRLGNNRLKDDLSSRAIHNEALSEYVGVSAPAHSLDGWSLLGRSINSLLKGDAYNAVHLAYYAELRAAISLLAAQGIGVYNQPHCVIKVDGTCELVNALDEKGRRVGSHQWTWLVFQWWAQEQRAIDLLRAVIRPNGGSLGMWVDAMNTAGFALEELGAEWLRVWGMDIGRFFADRDARNSASYWPNTINSWEQRPTVEDCQTVADIWRLLEPSSEARFAELDNHLLRIVLVSGYFAASGKRRTSGTGRLGFEREVGDPP